MADKQSGGIELSYRNGFFGDTSEREPLQLYRVIEREQESGRLPLPVSASEDGALLLYCVSGEGTAYIGEHTIPLREGVLLYGKDAACAIETACDVRLRYIVLDIGVLHAKDTAPLGALYAYFRGVTPLHMAQDANGLTALFTQLIAELCAARPMAVLVRGGLQQILVTAYRHFVRRKPQPLAAEPTMNAVGHTAYAIIRYVDEHLYSMNNLMDMAKDLGYSYNYLSHLFRRKTGMTIQTYVSRRKIEKSLELLQDPSLSVTEIASALNYDCIQSFSKAFKRVMQVSPTEYRTKHLPPPDAV